MPQVYSGGVFNCRAGRQRVDTSTRGIPSSRPPHRRALAPLQPREKGNCAVPVLCWNVAHRVPRTAPRTDITQRWINLQLRGAPFSKRIGVCQTAPLDAL